jgi:hypothetical protein
MLRLGAANGVRWHLRQGRTYGKSEIRRSLSRRRIGFELRAMLLR